MICIVLLLIGFGGTFVLSVGLSAGLLRIVIKILSALLFVGLAMTWVNRAPVKYRILKRIGTISLEMYVMQFVFLLLASGDNRHSESGEKRQFWSIEKRHLQFK